MPTREFLQAHFGELSEAARGVRTRAHGARITYSPKVFVPLTQLCRDRCGYCTFAKPPGRVAEPFMSMEEVLELARRGAGAGCHEALFTLGEAPEDRYPAARAWLEARGYRCTVEYLASAAEAVRDQTGLLPHANAGAVARADLALLRRVSASQGMMLESLNPDLACHRGCPDKTPARRLATLRAAGELRIPFTTGILVGIGESRTDRIEALEAISASHRAYGQVQEVIVQNFLPKPGTAMSQHPACEEEELIWSIAVARLVLPPEVHLQAPPNLTSDFGRLLDAGIDDWGGISPVTADHVNPERPWPALDALRQVTEARGLVLAPRLTVYPSFASDPDRWLDPAMRFSVLDQSDAECLARDANWFAGAEMMPPALVVDRGLSGGGKPHAPSTHAPSSRANPTRPRPGCQSVDGPVSEVIRGVELGQEVGEDEIVTLFSARANQVRDVLQLADRLRASKVGDVVTWVANRNINYTNVCTFKCRFCAFSKGPLSLNLRGSPYLLDLDEISRRVSEAVEWGATEVCLQGGIHPSFDGEYYVEVIKAVRSASSDIHIHGFTALEVTEGARRLAEPLESYLRRLMAAGLKTLPGTAAEILDDEIREVICPDKITTEEWLEAHRTAHRIGLRSNITIMFGTVENPRHWARHLIRTRSLQKETGGFTEFVPLPFVHMAAPIYLQRRSRRGPTFREALLMHAVGRIAYGSWVPNVQVSWVKMGAEGARQALQAGANDLGGTLMDENISRAAGASHGQAMDVETFRSIAEPLGRHLGQRTTLYQPATAHTDREAGLDRVLVSTSPTRGS